MHDITVQDAAKAASNPSIDTITSWAKSALDAKDIDCVEITIRLVDTPEMSELNENFRQKKGPTNVLSFPFGIERIGNDSILLGDIVICNEIVSEQAKEQNKSLDAHWAHMVVHGILHLLGHDHVEDEDAKIMETLEIDILKKLNFPNPYETREHE